MGHGGSFKQLRDHVKREHSLYYCEICEKHLKLFIIAIDCWEYDFEVAASSCFHNLSTTFGQSRHVISQLLSTDGEHSVIEIF